VAPAEKDGQVLNTKAKKLIEKPPQKEKKQGLENKRERQKTAAEEIDNTVSLNLQPPTALMWLRFAPPKFLLHCVSQKLHISAARTPRLLSRLRNIEQDSY